LLWCETVAVLAFGLAWLVKGETIFKDTQTSRPDPAAVGQGAA
jgi:hypothetical protein